MNPSVQKMNPLTFSHKTVFEFALGMGQQSRANLKSLYQDHKQTEEGLFLTPGEE